MKLYSVSFTSLAFALIGLALSLPELGNNVNPTTSWGGRTTNDNVKPMSTYLSGSWPAGQGYHTYGNGYYNLDVSGIPDNTFITISYQAGDTPNRFTLQNSCGGSQFSHNNSANPDPYNGWIGYTSNAGPWGMSGITGRTDGTLSTLKASGCNYILQVETVTNQSTDYWSVTY